MNKRDALGEMLLKSGAIMSGEFILKSGKKSNYYIDMKWASCNPHILDMVSDILKEEVRDYDRIGGLLVDGLPLATALSIETKIPMIIIRPEKQHEIEKEIEGEFKNGERAVLVDGMVTNAETKIKALNILKKFGLKCDKVVVVIDREEGSERLKDYGVKLHSIFKFKDLIKV
jgi:orotate phosphoribosyltransferase